MKFLVIGHKGMLGTDLFDLVRADPDSEAVGLDVPDIDITDSAGTQRLVKEHRPDVVVNCAAYTDVDGCEKNCDLAMTVNGDGARNCAQASKAARARFIHISTDFVFNGENDTPYTEGDEPDPISSYGESKLIGEEGVQIVGGNYAILRTAWLYGYYGNNFVDIMRRLLATKDELKIVTDQTGSPTYTKDLAGGIVAMARSEATGLFHCTNSGHCTRYEWVEEIRKLTGSDCTLGPATSADFPRPAARPAYSVLDLDRFHKASGHEMRPWNKALADYIHSYPKPRE